MGMDARLTHGIEVRFIGLLHFESLVKHLGHEDAWDANRVLEHVYFIRVVLLWSLPQSFNEWNDFGQVVNPKLVHHHHPTLLGELSYKFIISIMRNGWTTFKAGVEGFICYVLSFFTTLISLMSDNIFMKYFTRLKSYFPLL